MSLLIFTSVLQKSRKEFCACFLKLFLRTVFENRDNTIFVFFEIIIFSLNLVFSVFSLFSVFQNKKTGNQMCYPVFLCFACF